MSAAAERAGTTGSLGKSTGSLFTASVSFPAGPADAPRLILIGESLDRWAAAWAADLHADREAADALASLFHVQVIDAHQDPALTRRAAQVLAFTADAAGLPLALFCTPEGVPVGAVPWRPIRDQAKTPGVLRTALEFAEAWHQDAAAVRADAARLNAMLDGLAVADQGPALRPALVLDGAESAAIEAANTLEGGFGPAPRRLDPALLSFLVERCAREDAPLVLVQQVERTLAALTSGAAHDHLLGGFFRGCEDAAWSRPLAEKRLGDQARMALLLHRAATVLAVPLYANLARRTLAWVLADLARGDGLFAHGRHAGAPQATAGAAYAWTPQEMADLVGEDGAELLCQRFGLGENAPDQAGFLAIRNPTEGAAARRLPELVNRLAAARAERAQPPRDPSARLEEQGVLLQALAVVGGDLGLMSGDSRAAQRAAVRGGDSGGDLGLGVADVLALRLGAADVPACWLGDGTLEGQPTADALASVARGLLAHHVARGGRGVPASVLRLAERAFAALDANGHVVLATSPHIIGDTDDGDGPGPAAILGLLALEMARAGETSWKDRADRLVFSHRERLRRAPLALSGLLTVLHLAQEPLP